MKIQLRRVIKPDTFGSVYSIFVDNTLSKFSMTPELYRDFSMGISSDPVGEMAEIMWNEIHDQYGIKAASRQDSVKKQLVGILTQINKG